MPDYLPRDKWSSSRGRSLALPMLRALVLFMPWVDRNSSMELIRLPWTIESSDP